jgi:CBS domain-containing protein
MKSEEVAFGPAQWAKHSIGNEPHVILEALQRGLTVSLIATVRKDLVTCAMDQTLAKVVKDTSQNQFDFLPVTEAAINGIASRRIVGLLEIASYRGGATVDSSVAEAMRFLSEENLIGADASILEFVRDADHRRCCLVVSGNQISGLVTLSDLQRLPVRAALFGLVTHLEILMAEVIRREFKGSGEWLKCLSDGRQQALGDELERAQARDGLVDPLLFTQFADKKSIISKSRHLKTSKRKFDDELERIQSLRDHLAHANDYAASPEAASKTCETVRLLDKWREEFSRWLRNEPDPRDDRLRSDTPSPSIRGALV